jgi:Tfp pilus assembly protein PilF
MLRWILAALLLATSIPAQEKTPPPPEPPEEDQDLVAAKEYTFNPLQAQKELRIGNFYFKKGSYRAAANRFDEATKWDPNYAEAFLRLGEAREKRREPALAREAYSKYVELAPDAKNIPEIRRRIAKLTK